MKATGLILLACASCAAPMTHQLSAAFANRSLDHSAWEPLDDQDGFGIEYVGTPGGIKLNEPSFGFEAGLMATDDDMEVFNGFALVDAEASVAEAYGGGRMTYKFHESFAFYASAGLTSVYAEVDGALDDDDSSTGFYYGAGLDVYIDEHLSGGFFLREVTNTDIEMLGYSGDADGQVVGIKIGGVWTTGSSK